MRNGKRKTLMGWGIWVLVFAVLAVIGETDFHLDHTVIFFIILIVLTVLAILGFHRLLRTEEK